MARVLCVEDSEQILDLYAQILGQEGHCVETAPNGLEGLDRILTEEFDLVLSDVGMPGMDGPGMFEEAAPHLAHRTPRILEVQEYQRTDVEDRRELWGYEFSLVESGGIGDLRRIVNQAVAMRAGWLARAHEASLCSEPSRWLSTDDRTPWNKNGRTFRPWTPGPDEGPRADRELVEAALRSHARLRGVSEPPAPVWCDSPLEGTRVVSLSLPGAGPTLHPGLAPGLGHPHDDRPSMPVAPSSTLAAGAVRSALYAAIRELPSRLQPGHYLAALHGIDWQSAKDTQPPSLVDAQTSRDPLVEILAKQVGWAWLYEDGFAVLTEPHGPPDIDDGGHFHNPERPAIEYPDGFGACALWGFEVPRVCVEFPEEVPIAAIRTTRNAELRRILLKRYGEDRYDANLAARLIDVDTVPVQASASEAGSITRALVEDVDGNRYLVASDGSTRRVYYMRVPSSCNDCREAYVSLSGRSDVRTIVEA